MYLTLTNTTNEPEAIGTPDGDFVDVLQTQTPYDFHQDEVDVLLIGDKPTVREQFETAFQRMGSVARHLLTLIAGRKKHAVDAGRPELVNVAIANHGANAVRVILGDGTTDITIEPGQTQACSAAGYLELRELGHAAQQGGTPE